MYNENATTQAPMAGRAPTLEEQQKQKQQQAAQYGDCETTGQTAGVLERTLRERLQFEVNRGHESMNNSRKALRILEQHPEFEDFLWLLRSGIL